MIIRQKLTAAPCDAEKCQAVRNREEQGEEQKAVKPMALRQGR